MTNPPTSGDRLFDPARVARDYALVIPGFFLSLGAFVVLVTLFALSIGTLAVWVGALLLPLTLTVASGFAQLSRARVRAWGADLPPAHYPPARPGMMGFARRMAEPRRWLDLVYETVVAFPLRTVTFCLAVTWTLGGVGGVSYLLWGVFLPEDNDSLPGLVLEAVTDGAAPDSLTRSFWLDATFMAGCGIVLLLTTPLMMRGLAALEAVTARAALGGDVGAGEPTTAPVPTPAAGASSPSAEGWIWIAAVLTAIVSIAVGWPVLATAYATPVVTAMVLSLAYLAALLLTVRWPAVGIVVQTVAVSAGALLIDPSTGWPWPWPTMTLILQTILVGLLALGRPWPWAVAGWLLPQAGVLVAAIGRDADGWSTMIVSAAVSLAVLAVGLIVRQLITSHGALQAERRANADLSAQRRELDERNRIAQELHDVVAHSMSVISVQATTAPYRLTNLDAEAEHEFRSIAEASRSALAEMRTLLTVLRSSGTGHETPLAPQPTLADIPTLVATTRQSGATIALRREPPEGIAERTYAAVPAATGLTAYRIVQEALSNAVRHAPGSDIDVVVELTDAAIHLDITNTAATRTGTRPAPGAGLGLAGVRERTAALGGSVEAGPTPDGGFRVRAVLPLG